MRRFLLAALLVATACAALPFPAAAFPPGARTDNPTEVTDSGATLNGLAYPNGDQGPVTYHFQYGPTSAYGQRTPEAQAPPMSPSGPQKVSQRVALPGGSTFHFRIVATNAGGEKGFGQNVEWRTPGAVPPPPGATRTSDTVGPGGTVTTGSNPSNAKPIVVSVKAEKGGKITIDQIPNPDRPGADPDAQENPEDDGPKDKNWYGPAIRISPPAGPDTDDPDSAPRQQITLALRLDAGTDLIDPTEWRRLLSNGEYPRLMADRFACFNARSLRFGKRTVAGGDTVITFKFACASDRPFTLHFYNPGWGVRGGESFGSSGGDLARAVDQRAIYFGLACTLKCSRTITGSISRESARKLGLKSNVLGRVRTDRGESYNGKFPLNATVRRAFKKIVRSGGQITVSFRAKAVGPDGQVFKKGDSARLKAESQDDNF
jgi:hypothetical protein